MATEYPEKVIEFVRSVAQDNLVALHTHQTWPGGDEYVTMDFFRFHESGKIVEQWESIGKAGRWSHSRDPYLLESSVPGNFACGDVRLSPVKRVASAVGEGSMAIAFVHKYLQQDAR